MNKFEYGTDPVLVSGRVDIAVYAVTWCSSVSLTRGRMSRNSLPTHARFLVAVMSYIQTV
jgi:hypothetical protein